MMSCGYEGLDQDRHPMSSGATTSAGRQKKAVGEVLGQVGGYGSGFVWKHKCHPAANPKTDLTTQVLQLFAAMWEQYF